MNSSQQSDILLNAILESPPNIVIFALDRQYRYLAFNQNHARTMRAIWGVDIAIGLDMLSAIGREDDRNKAKQNFLRALSGESFVLEEAYGDTRLLRAVYQNRYSPIHDISGEVTGLTVYLTDVTAERSAQAEVAEYRDHLEELVRRRTQELEEAHAQLLQVRKLESLGVLVGGIAHDFNNLLAVILSRCELAQIRLAQGESIGEHLHIVRETTLEARELTRQLLGYSGKGRFRLQAVALNEIVSSVFQLLRASVSPEVELEFVLEEPDLLVVDADVTQIRQILLNLVINAAEAANEAKGHIRVSTRRAELTAEHMKNCRPPGKAKAGSYAVIEVVDNGRGMTKDVLERLFEPFFSTKFSGRGLGLAAVQGIVSGHQGVLFVSSQPGEGARFEVCLPLSHRPPHSLTASPVLSLTTPRGNGTILVVDDEDAVRSAAAAMLGQLGYQAVLAKGGREAVKVFEKQPNFFDMVLLDLTMPECDGLETFAELQAIDADVRVVLFTGYAEDEQYLRGVHGRLAGFLTKPFGRDELALTVRTALQGRTRGATAEPPEPTHRSDSL